MKTFYLTVNLLPWEFQVAGDRGHLPGYLTSVTSFLSLTSNYCNFMCGHDRAPVRMSMEITQERQRQMAGR